MKSTEEHADLIFRPISSVKEVTEVAVAVASAVEAVAASVVEVVVASAVAVVIVVVADVEDLVIAVVEDLVIAEEVALEDVAVEMMPSVSTKLQTQEASLHQRERKSDSEGIALHSGLFG